MRWILDFKYKNPNKSKLLCYNVDEADDIPPKEYSLHVVGLLLLNAAQIVLTPPAPRNGGPFLPFFGQAGQVDPLVGWRCCY